MNKPLYLLVIFLLVAPLSIAVADQGEWYLAVAPVYFESDADRRLDSEVGGQLNVGYELSRRFLLEGHFGYHDAPGLPLFDPSGGLIVVQENQDFLDLGFNVISRFNPGGRFNPYLIGGIGYLGTSTSITEVDDSRASITGGLGFMYRIGQSRFAIRNEYRARFAYDSDLSYTDYLISLGIQYSFGKRRSVPVPINDSDNDGVLDDVDQCPYSEPGETVGPDGCGVFLDSDGDGVPDSRDLCADTPGGVPVDSYGCISDVDGDGVTDDIDECPNTRPGVPVGSDGCEIVATYELRGVNFEIRSDRLLPGADQVLDDAARWLLENPQLVVEVAGHTDSDGSTPANLALSDRRANTVRDYLISKGVDPNRIVARGYGETQPIADNETPEGRAANRRVELRVLGR